MNQESEVAYGHTQHTRLLPTNEDDANVSCRLAQTPGMTGLAVGSPSLPGPLYKTRSRGTMRLGAVDLHDM